MNILIRRHWLFLLVILSYSALGIPQLSHGLGTLDGHLIVRSIRALAEQHIISYSRPPGHPTTEIYLYGTVALVLRTLFNQPFTDTVYLWLQFLVGLATAFAFYEWLCRLNFSLKRSAVGVCCLIFSAQFLSNSFDGEEFVVPILCLIVALRILTLTPGRISQGKLFVSMLLWSLAVGCRPELLFAGIIFPLYFWLRPELGLKKYARALPLQLMALVLVWLPILISVGFEAPWGSGMTWKQTLLGGTYKLAFQCFTFPVFVMLICGLWHGARNLKKSKTRPFPDNFVALSSWLIAAGYCLLFLTYAAKPAYALIVVPFFVVLACRRSALFLGSLALVTILDLFITVDIFQDRHLTAPHLKPGAWSELTAMKPASKLGYLNRLASQHDKSPIIVIANLWPWDFEYHFERGTFPAKRLELEKDNPLSTAYQLPGTETFLMERDTMRDGEFLQHLHARGFTIKLDQLVYRQHFAKYDLNYLNKASVEIEGVPVTLFTISP